MEDKKYAYKTTVTIGLSDGVFPPSSSKIELRIELGSKDEIETQLATALDTTSKHLELQLRESVRNWDYFTKFGWRHFLTNGNCKN